MTSRSFVVGIAAVCVAGFLPGRASAHDLRGIVKVPLDAVIVEAYFSDDTRAQNATVTIIDEAGYEVLHGKTDDTGVCRFARIGPGKFVAVIELIGHRDEIRFEVADSVGVFEFYNWRLNKNLGVAIGVVGLLGGSGAFWLLRRRKYRPMVEQQTYGPGSE